MTTTPRDFRSESAILSVLTARRVDDQALADDAQRRGRSDEAKRHTALVERLEAIIAKTDAA